MKRDVVPTSIAAAILKCSTRHIRNLFWRGCIKGYFKSTTPVRRGLLIYRESLENHRDQDLEE